MHADFQWRCMKNLGHLGLLSLLSLELLPALFLLLSLLLESRCHHCSHLWVGVVPGIWTIRWGSDTGKVWCFANDSKNSWLLHYQVTIPMFMTMYMWFLRLGFSSFSWVLVIRLLSSKTNGSHALNEPFDSGAKIWEHLSFLAVWWGADKASELSEPSEQEQRFYQSSDFRFCLSLCLFFVFFFHSKYIITIQKSFHMCLHNKKKRRDRISC